ncbi:MAG: SRPBCC family protein [Planctomycetes bacterium]|nr:SRPBCC family protein [Planctomycetota bacterium]
MRRYTTDDSRLIENRSPAAVFRVLADFESYNRWFPREVRFRILQLIPGLVASKLEVLIAKHRFTAEVVRYEAGKSMEWAFRSELYAGQGRWSLEEIEADTRLSYKSDLPVHPSLIAEHFLNAKDFAAKHAAVMRKAFVGLEKYLEEVAR